MRKWCDALMDFFNKYFGEGSENSSSERFVKCPFHDDKIASAHVNTEKSVFHCKACDVGLSEPAFLAKTQGVSYGEALEILNLKKQEGTWSGWVEKLKENEARMKQLQELGIHSIVDELQIGYRGDGFAFPVHVFGEILDVRTYDPNGQPKIKSESGAKSLILPFDLWREDHRPTLLCAGEKDMAIARLNGFNAITFTGGEGSFPRLFKGSFRGKRIYIAYDNDDAGRNGALKVATLLKEAGAEPYIVTSHYLVCADKGEDIHDFFQKYKKSSQDLQNIFNETPPFDEEAYNEQRNILYPLVNLEESTQGKYTGKVISSRVSVVATFEEVYKIPEVVEVEKFKTSENCTIKKGTYTWSLSPKTMRDILYMCDSNLKENEVKRNIKMLLDIPEKEKFISVRIRSYTRIFKAVVADEVEAVVIDDLDAYRPREMTVYSGQPMNSGEKYRIFYETHGHPLQAQRIVGIIHRMETSDTSIQRFKVTEEVKESLKVFQGDVNEKMEEIYQRSKAIAGVETQRMIQWTVDLFYHTPLYFNFGKRTERAYLEPFLLGATRTGKSQTAKKLLELYELGIFTSFKTSTVTSLIGGLDKALGKLKLGVLPRNHKGAVIIEEFSGGGKDYIKQLTDIRSSNMVRIHRVSGELNVPAMVRMLTISNQATNSGGQTIPLSSYPNGVKILLDLIGATEDMARYDFFIMVDEPEDGYTSPLDEIEDEALPKEAYLNRVRWVWSRKADQIVMERSVMELIVKKAEWLNSKFDCHIKFFGAEAWKKLARVAIAVAGCVCSTDEEGENLIVKEEHVNWATNFLDKCYDNELFKLREYVESKRHFVTCPDDVLPHLEGLYTRHPTVIQQLEMATELSQTQLRNVSNMEAEDFTAFINTLAQFHFIDYTASEKITPSARFRKALAKIKRNQYIKEVGQS
jgi:hypothetical protein